MFIIDQVRAIAASAGSAVAISAEDIDMTYEAFVQRVDGLALALRVMHVGSGDRVAIALPRSCEMIIAIFGVLAAGATYIPLDPTNPPSRLNTILQDAEPSLLLSDDEGAYLSVSSGIRLLKPNDWPHRGPIANPETAAGAYIIYTSGSTGNPKGVEVGHRALDNYVKWATTALPFTGGGVPLFTSISFDHAITNIFPPLMKGERIVLLPPILGGRALASGLLSRPHLLNAPYSYVKITPSLFEFLDKEQRAQLGRCTNLLMFGGEKLSPALIADARRDNPSLAIMNHYGPTETTVGCCVYNVPEGFSGTAVPIGKPIAGAEAVIRRADLSIADPGEEGELFIGGPALANGYWGRPDLTAKSFLEMPDDTGNKRWYRTGDLACRMPDGNIQYLGRMDDQVKILGNRIEPAEIMMHLTAFPEVSQSVVFTFAHAASVELVAALTFFRHKPPAEAIRKHLQSLLPAAMVPARYLILDEMPVAASGKIDLNKLRSMLTGIKNDVSIEESVANKFREILCLENISKEDDYFLLGGDSLGTVEIATWAAAYYSIPLDIACIFDYPTIGLLSGHIRELVNRSTGKVQQS